MKIKARLFGPRHAPAPARGITSTEDRVDGPVTSVVVDGLMYISAEGLARVFESGGPYSGKEIAKALRTCNVQHNPEP